MFTDNNLILYDKLVNQVVGMSVAEHHYYIGSAERGITVEEAKSMETTQTE